MYDMGRKDRIKFPEAEEAKSKNTNLKSYPTFNEIYVLWTY